MKKKIIITGSSGDIGRSVYINLKKNNSMQVIGIDRRRSSTCDLVTDISDYKVLKNVIKECDSFIHVAALHAPDVPFSSNSTFLKTNVSDTETIYKMCAEAGVKKLIFASTCALYGYASTEGNIANWITEKISPRPRTIYHESKILAENKLEMLSNGSQTKVLSLRIGRCFPEPLNNMAIYRLHRGIDVRDISSAFIASIDYQNQKDFDIFNISYPTCFQKEDCELLREDAISVIYQRSPKLFHELKRRNLLSKKILKIDRIYNSEKALTALNWKPRWSWEEIFKQYDNDISTVLPPLLS